MSSFALILWLKKSQAVWWGSSSLKMPMCLLARKAMWGPDEKWQRAGCSGPTISKFHIPKMEPLEPPRFHLQSSVGTWEGRGQDENQGGRGRMSRGAAQGHVSVHRAPLASHLLASVMVNSKLEHTAHQLHAPSLLEVAHFLPVLVWDHFFDRYEWF